MAQKGVNKVIILGRVGDDPVLRYSPQGTAFATVSVATSETWNDKQTGEPKELTEWHSVALAGKLAEIAGQYVKKGDQIYFEGMLRTRKWTDQQSGQDRYRTEVYVGINGTMQLLNNGRTGQGGQQSGGHNQPQNSGRPPQQQHNGNAPQGGQPQQQGGGAYDFDDDIPFAPIGLSVSRTSLYAL